MSRLILNRWGMMLLTGHLVWRFILILRRMWRTMVVQVGDTVHLTASVEIVDDEGEEGKEDTT